MVMNKSFVVSLVCMLSQGEMRYKYMRQAHLSLAFYHPRRPNCDLAAARPGYVVSRII
jgi:hypothetical protein